MMAFNQNPAQMRAMSDEIAKVFKKFRAIFLGVFALSFFINLFECGRAVRSSA